MQSISVQNLTAIADLQNITDIQPWWNRPLGNIMYQEQPWWNRPLWGKNNCFDLAQSQIHKHRISLKAIALYRAKIKDLEQITQQAEKLELEVFSNQEFLLFLQLNKNFTTNHKRANITGRSAQLLLMALQTKSIFHETQEIILEENQFEHFLNISQQFVSSLARKRSLHDCFNSLLQQEKISDNLLEQLVELIMAIPGEFYWDLTALIALVKLNQKLFDRISEISFIFPSKSDHQAYAKIIQYLALWYKYQVAYSQFKLMLAVWQTWEKYYQQLVNLKLQYHGDEYKQPKDWQLSIPGFNFYQQYQPYLNI